MDVFVALARFPYKVVDRFACQQAFEALEVSLVELSRLKAHASDVAIVAARFALEHLLRLNLLAVSIALLAHLAE